MTWITSDLTRHCGLAGVTSSQGVGCSTKTVLQQHEQYCISSRSPSTQAIMSTMEVPSFPHCPDVPGKPTEMWLLSFSDDRRNDICSTECKRISDHLTTSHNSMQSKATAHLTQASANVPPKKNTISKTRQQATSSSRPTNAKCKLK